jgi:hypothetical protein|tara:strand:+ start:13094 stop:13483 length:390 start_codon:yes stop_codon:yes gene_type:complete
MANEYQTAFNDFVNGFDGIEIKHSGYSGFASTVQEWFEFDEVEAEESFSNYLDSEGLELLVSLEDCLNDTDLTYVLEEQCYDNFISGNKQDFIEEYSNICPVDFETYIEQNLTDADQLKICKYIILNCF